MLKNLFANFLRKFGYGAAGNLLVAFSEGVTSHNWIGSDPMSEYVWRTVFVGFFTGLVSTIIRRMKWDPSRTR